MIKKKMKSTRERGKNNLQVDKNKHGGSRQIEVRS